jgi:hypothetical protein
VTGVSGTGTAAAITNGKNACTAQCTAVGTDCDVAEFDSGGGNDPTAFLCKLYKGTCTESAESNHVLLTKTRFCYWTTTPTATLTNKDCKNTADIKIGSTISMTDTNLYPSADKLFWCHQKC